jgi:hypothetical protein
MIAVFVTFRYGADFDAAKLHQIAATSKARFEGVPGLRSKVYSISPERREARNVYVWDDERAAHAFFTQDTQDRIAARYGVTPLIEYAEIGALVENSSH